MHVPACTHIRWKHAPHFCAFFATLKKWKFEAFPYWKWKKNNGTLKIGIDKTFFFLFIHFFPFQSGSPPKWPKCVKKWSKFHFFDPGGQNMKHRNKSHKIKKSFTMSSKVIRTDNDIQKWARGPQWWAEGPPLIF